MLFLLLSAIQNAIATSQIKVQSADSKFFILYLLLFLYRLCFRYYFCIFVFAFFYLFVYILKHQVRKVLVVGTSVGVFCSVLVVVVIP